MQLEMLSLARMDELPASTIEGDFWPWLSIKVSFPIAQGNHSWWRSSTSIA